jgi:phosphatidate cytidylyltransferase
MHPVFYLTSGYFLVGSAAVFGVTRRAAASERTKHWTKLAVYWVIVHSLILSILAGVAVFVPVAIALVLVGLAELLRVASARPGEPAGVLVVALPLYAVLAAGFVHFARTTPPSMILFVYVVVLTFDGFSQITGQLLGRRKLAPRISPGKTIEGLAGGLAMAGVTALPAAAWAGVDRAPALGVALLIAVAALAGDLLASCVKRACGVKDYGRWIPGHGGVLDRFDSFIAAGGVFWSVASR